MLFRSSKTRPGFPISSLLPAFRPASVVTSDFEKAEVTTDAGRKAGRREEMGKPGRVFDATNVSKTVVKALEMDAEGDVFIGASGRVLALVATHLSPLVKRYWRNRYRRVLGRAGG